MPPLLLLLLQVLVLVLVLVAALAPLQAAPIPSVMRAKGDMEEAAAAPALCPVTMSCTHSPYCRK